MAGITVDLEFDGYWRESNKGSVPEQSGIYCVYACTYNADKKTVSLRELIYIGESADVRHRLATHNKLEDWASRLKSGETLCYSVAKIPPANRVRVEAALINKLTPPENSEYTGEFPYNKTTVNTSGRNSHLPGSLSVGSL
ncbi:GIY-YIG nuclease family protein [Enterobacter ludwigii]|nr:GIY-YIG nuclease family protein [Enterobacter ludwigii]